jgi:hypothetical protein
LPEKRNLSATEKQLMNMKSTLTGMTLAACSLAASQTARAALVISEVLANELGSDTDGEWFEIYNNGAETIDLSGYKLGDEEASGQTSETEGMYQFPAGAMIGPGQVQVVAVNANQFQAHYGFLPTYENGFSDATGPGGDNAGVPNMVLYTTWDADGTRINAANGNDQMVLLGSADQIVDAVSWGNTFAFDPGITFATGNGESFERANPRVDTNTAADWRLAAPGTPGTVPVPEPAAALLALVGLGALRIARPRRSHIG